MKHQVAQFFILLTEQWNLLHLDKETAHAKERVMPAYAELVYNGYWFSKKRIKASKNN